MLEHKILRIDDKSLEAIRFKLGKKNLIAIKGRRGYIMCGYLNLKVSESFGEVAVIASGVSTIAGMIRGHVSALSPAAKKLGIYKNQPIRDVFKIIA